MERGDVARVTEIARASLPEAWTEAGFAAELDKASSACLVLGEPIVGFAIGAVVAGELEVLTIAVDPASRREGQGRALLGALLAEARARGARHAFLEVRASNVPAIALYESAGFTANGRRARYYADGEDALLMASSLAT